MRRLASVLFTAAGATVAAFAACYSPNAKDCQYQCNGNACPSGFACESGVCRIAGHGSQCGTMGGVDGPNTHGDGGGPDTAPPGCSLATYHPLNASPSDVPLDDRDVTDATLGNAWNTDNSGTEVAGGTMRALHFRSLTVHNMLTVTGTRPGVIFADTITVDTTAKILVATTRMCLSPNGPQLGLGNGGGGGGGGAGGAGGPGGLGTQGSAAGGPQISATGTAPTPGCNGASAAGNAGGHAGGAIQLVAQKIVMNGQVLAVGAGGKGSTTSANGGAGGGAGGTILLDGCVVEGAGFLCATGGGGGGGAGSGSSISSRDGADGGCLLGGGGGGAGSGGAGGNGGNGNQAAASGGPASGTVQSAGGGGGGAGRVIIRTYADPDLMGRPEHEFVLAPPL